MNIFRCQMTSEVMELMMEEKILLTCVPNNLAHMLKLLDLTVNLRSKNFMKSIFATCSLQKIKQGLDTERDVTTQMPLGCKVDDRLHNKLTAKKSAKRSL